MRDRRTAAGLPFLDLAPSHAPLKTAILEEIAELVTGVEAPIGRDASGHISRQNR
jgi:hypothetical protein